MDKKYVRKSEIFCVIMLLISNIFLVQSLIQNNKKEMILTIITSIALGYILNVFAKEMRNLHKIERK